MSLRSQFDEVADSIRNGQRRQARRQMAELDSDEVCLMLDYFSTDLEDTDLVLDAAKTFIRFSVEES